jgi:hypothetical protein
MKYRLKQEGGFTLDDVFERRTDRTWSINGEPASKLDNAFLNVVEAYGGLQPIDDKPKRWRSEKGGQYYFVDFDYGIETALDFYHRTDDIQYKFGNYFQTIKQAEAAADAFKALFAFIHDPDAETFRILSDGTTLELCKAANNARQAVQGGDHEN